ncbi:hypothetical protein ACFYWH_42175 [Streptomyces sp. NPDC003737]|uniref:hypothetical protein n=1 Tax=Streptomyces sp. NPDC003737 TaxID=3364685 RepID=UPI0036B4E301
MSSSIKRDFRPHACVLAAAGGKGEARHTYTPIRAPDASADWISEYTGSDTSTDG